MDKIKVVGYCRVSTEYQKDEGTIEIQRQALTEYARDNNLELVAIFEDEGVSGGLEYRPGLADLYRHLETSPETAGVLIYKLDRLARDIRIQENFIYELGKMGKSLISTKEPDLDSKDPTRILFRQIMGSYAQFEKAMITMRLTAGRINKARKGKHAGGGVALGYQSKDRDLTIDEDRAETIKKIFYLKRYKRLGLRGIARELNARGIKTARGGQWHAGTIRYILNNPIYKGRYSYKEIETIRTDLALITR